MKKFFLFTIVCAFFTLVNAQTEPANQPTNLNFSSLKTYKSNISFSSSSADGYLILISKQSISFTPTDNQTYTKGQVINGAKVVTIGSGTFTVAKNLLQDNEYHIAVFAYNQQGANINYKSDNPLTGTVNTPAADFGNYYNTVDWASANVVGILTSLIQPHTQIPYSQFDETIIADFFETDTAIGGNAQKYVNCQYSNEKRLYTGTFAFVTPQPGYSREHRMAFSWVNFQGITRDDFEETDEGCDVHALELVQGDVNSNRSNEPFGIVDNEWANSYLDFRIGTDVGGLLVAEPRDDRKGDIARSVFYMMLAYNGKYGENWGLDNLLTAAQDQDIQVLLDWHYNDLPDDFEKTRHEYVFEQQGNRNPLIDFPQLVDCIDFTNMTKKANCDVSTGINNRIKEQFGQFVYPNPTKGQLFYQDLKAKDIISITIYNLIGIQQNNFTFNTDSIDVQGLEKGMYVLSIQTKKRQYISKFLLK